MRSIDNSDTAQDSRPFQVNLRGVIDLLSRHIYSSPKVYLRELLQNGVDAITARRQMDPDGPARGIRIIVPATPGGDLMIVDEGIGLTRSDVSELLATVGASSKRDSLDLPRGDYLGQFGIGLLSCFMVSDTIVVHSRSARGGSAVEWRGQSDGTFTVSTTEDDWPIGTTVRLTPRVGAEPFCSAEAVAELAAYYGRFLSVDITVVHPDGRENTVTEPAPFLSDDPDTVRQYGEELLHTDPFDVIGFDVAETGTRGVGYVLNASPPPGARQANRVHLSGMLVSESADLLPDWAFFVRAVVDSQWLKPTASRESLVVDDAFEATRDRLGEAVRAWILRMGTTSPHRMAHFVAIHGLALKGLLLHDEELARIVVRWLTVETTAGRVTIDQVMRQGTQLRYAEDVDEFRQLASFERGDDLLINAGYTYDADVIRLLPRLFPGVVVERVTAQSRLESLSVPPLEDRSRAKELEARVTQALEPVSAVGLVRVIADPQLPAVCVVDERIARSLDRRKTAGTSGSLWAGVLEAVDRHIVGDDDKEAATKLCVNWRSPVISALERTTDEAVFTRTVHLLYIQALLAGHHRLTGPDRALMNQALTDVLALSLGTGPWLPLDDEGVL